MRPTVSQVLGWRPDAAVAAADGVVAANREFVAAMGAVGNAVDVAVSRWEGSAATAHALRALEAQWAANHIDAALADIADALADVAALAGVCAIIAEIDGEARANGCEIGEDGTVRPPRAESGNAALDVALQVCFDAQARTLQARLVPLLDTAGETDREVAARLAAAVTALAALRHAPGGGPLDHRVADVLAGRAFLPEDPNALRALWESLAPADKDALFAYDPSIGNRDGIPAIARDFYNRAALDLLRADARADLAILETRQARWAEGHRPDSLRDWNRWHDLRDEIQLSRQRLAEYDAVEAVIGTVPAGADPPADGPRRYLLALDDNGRAAIAIQNPDAARNVATLVPGTASPLTGIGGGVARARALYESALAADRHTHTSVIAWYGYPSPPWLGRALLDSYADAGAPALDRFQDGLRATHAALPSRNTVIGHSYGSTLIGVAAADPGALAADALVFAGSPGVEVSSAADLRLDGIAPEHNREHVFATADPADPVAAFGPLSHGVSPVHPDFGATVFESADPNAGPEHPRVLGWDVRAHSNYWAVGNPGLTTQGEIITNTYNR
ncbi:alpha/beta hydrolase [Nocardia sp. NPDC055321]